MSQMSKEREYALKLADKILERPNADPDDDLAVLSRQLMRAQEDIERNSIPTAETTSIPMPE